MSPHHGDGYFHCSPDCGLGSHEVVVVVAGSSARRRAALEWAGNYAGGTGFVHVVFDGLLSVVLSGPILAGGLTDNADYLENAGFAGTAEVLARFGCGWSWRLTRAGARGVAIRMARDMGAITVLPRRGVIPHASRPRIVLPLVAGPPADHL